MVTLTPLLKYARFIEDKPMLKITPE